MLPCITKLRVPRAGRFLAAVSLLAVATAACLAPRLSAEDRPPNIVLIVADDLGYGDLGCFGQKKFQTPNLDRLAAEGMRFTSFYAGSTVCAPSRCVLMTGLHTGHCFIRGNARHNLPAEQVTVAEVLASAGYTCGLIGKWGLGQEGTTGVPTRQGFDYFFGYLDQHHAHNYYPTFLLRNEQRVRLDNVVPDEHPSGAGVASRRVQYSHDLFTAEALEFLQRHRQGPFFLALTYTVPHANNEAGSQGMEVPDHGPFAQQDWPQPEKGFAAMVHRLDSDVGKLLQRLKDLGLDQRTLVLFTSDNGPHREGGRDPNFFRSSGPLRGIKRDLYEGGIRVPTIARWPGVVPAGRTCDAPLYFADFLPTAAELAGAATDGLTTDGISFVSALRGQEPPEHECLYWEFYERGFDQAVRMGRWKAVRRSAAGNRIELYDLSQDLGEKHNVAAEHPDVVRRAEQCMDRAHVPSPLWKPRR